MAIIDDGMCDDGETIDTNICDYGTDCLIVVRYIGPLFDCEGKNATGYYLGGRWHMVGRMGLILIVTDLVVTVGTVCVKRSDCKDTSYL